MSTHKIIIAGFGGQGVLLIGQLMAYAAMMEGKEVTWMPSYGPEMRGGTANCTVIVSEKKIASPLVTQATAVAAMNGPSLEKFKDLIVPGGDLFINTSIITGDHGKEGVNTHNVDCMGLAAELENTKVANMVMLGAIYQVTSVVSEDSLRAAMEKTFSGGKAKLVDINMKALYAWKG
ncbi:MAG: 2-oxoacid:acceptor oxidoreductase family protein [Clostridiales bacterium]|nr:2-oxoacid:acceptor oxidoreductase family protein [Clostridiales bacterium]